jgi:hypothetical protein
MSKMRWYDHITINIFWLGLNVRNTAVGSVFTPYLLALPWVLSAQQGWSSPCWFSRRPAC